MDIKGSIKDPSLRIIPSKKLLTFLKSINPEEKSSQFVKHVLNPKEPRKPVKHDLNLRLNQDDYQKLDEITKSFPKSPEKRDFNKSDKKSELNELSSELFLTVDDLECLQSYIEERRKDNEDVEYLHELLEGCEIKLPENEIIPRNPQLEARCEKLRKEQANRDYRAMTKNVDNVRVKQPDETIAYQMKHLNKQLIAVGQFIISVGAGFLFGFLGVEMMIGRLDFGFRLLLGVICALIIALAEIYFLAKKLNEDIVITETVQIGGPTVFQEEKKKPHQD